MAHAADSRLQCAEHGGKQGQVHIHKGLCIEVCVSTGMTVMQVTGCNVESVAESEVMRILLLVRNFVEGYKQVCIPCQRSQFRMRACEQSFQSMTRSWPRMHVAMPSS